MLYTLPPLRSELDEKLPETQKWKKGEEGRRELFAKENRTEVKGTKKE